MIRAAYLAYPLDQGYHEKMDLWKQAVADALLAEDALVYDPGAAWTITPQTALGVEIERVNRAAIATCDTLVALLPRNVVSIGVPMEIEAAVRMGKQVIVFSDAPSWALAGMGHRYDLEIGVIGQVIKEYHGLPEVEQDGQDPLAFAKIDGARGDYEMHLGDGSKIGQSATLPTRGYPNDAGLDLTTSVWTRCAPGQFTEVPTGLAVEIPEWGWGLICGRSSALRRGLFVKDAVIDPGYRGELFANVWNLTTEPIDIQAGERISQLIVMPNLTRDLQPVMVQQLNSSDRGTNGFGSTGR